MKSVSIVGVSGYSGMELARLLDHHAELELRGVVADRWQKDTLGAHVRMSGPAAKLVVAPMSEALNVAANAEIALLATPADVSAQLAPELIARGVRVVDLSGAFRLTDPEAYPRWYGFAHPAPELLAEARFGLPEVPGAAEGAPSYAEARLVANPGCYATAAIAALAPLLAGRVLEPTAIFVDGKSGVTGAGRKVEERLLFTEVDENVSPYRVGNHQHVPEIEQALSRVAKKRVHVTFVPHLLPVRRGLLVTAYGRLTPGTHPNGLEEVLRMFYGDPGEGDGEIEVTAIEQVTLTAVVGTSRARIGVRGDAERGTVVAAGALDNLLKGAASQAIQNVCEMVRAGAGRRSE